MFSETGAALIAPSALCGFRGRRKARKARIMLRIAICAPSTPISTEVTARVAGIAGDFEGIDLYFHEQCHASSGHFAGDDETRLAALLECANDPAFDAVWFARGGYGANRIAAAARDAMGPAAGEKLFLGYSDGGYLLAALHARSIGRQAHASMPVDITRDGGEEAIRRVLSWLSGDESGVESSSGEAPRVAFNLITLAMLCGTDLMPDLAGHEVLVEEVSEHLYAIDRLFFHVTQHLRDTAGLRLGRISEVPENDRPFGSNPEQIARYWCDRSGIPYLGHADIGHDAGNKIVPFGLAGSASQP
jgi:muramoyltetrapeptide carboxypeptidase